MILLTGASGFVGQALLAPLRQRHRIRIVVRDTRAAPCPQGVAIVQASLSTDQDWSAALSGVDVVVHCAARVHIMNDVVADPLAEFRRVNVAGTLHLARQAAQAGARRFVFLSSIKVNGERTLPGMPFTAEQPPAPEDAYAISKREAEDGLRVLAQETGMEVVVIRPPLVYGPGVKANFLAMMRWLARGVPLPLGGIAENRRSLVALENLVDLVATCIEHPAAANQVFLVSDGEDLSTAALLRRMAKALGRPARLISLPTAALSLAAGLIGRPGLAQRLCASLEVDIGKTKKLLAWSPPLSVDEGLRRTAEHWLNSKTGPSR
ncbi:SDR family oxidoreductase [Candidatus Accumulibacter sp. ACC003]|uniref:UDP-glucose 4-epimerase family protein n=1 Tax=Candidatus Accumulibacter sp. ACC003 TaxID=2823334 RepID=UPI0025C1728C|nr:SDR family oxidoreductase [Candidatus Accumulibacter sp. ACC003]